MAIYRAAHLVILQLIMILDGWVSHMGSLLLPKQHQLQSQPGIEGIPYQDWILLLILRGCEEMG